jgi:hypothetical protein
MMNAKALEGVMSFKRYFILLGLIWGQPALSADPIVQLPPFEFKGIRADQPVDNPRDAGLNGCSRRQSNWTCITPSPLAGGWSVSTYQFIGSYLRSLNIKVSRSNYQGLRAAFETKYGPPCKANQSKWRNMAGASLDNSELTWCFSTGNLTLFEIGDRINNTQAIYTDATLLMESKKPVVDF